MIFFDCSAQSIALVARWGRRFRLPTCDVHPKETPALASGRLLGSLAICDLAIGGIATQKPIHQKLAGGSACPTPGQAFVTHRVRLEQAPDAFAMLAEYRDGVGKLAVEFPS